MSGIVVTLSIWYDDSATSCGASWGQIGLPKKTPLPTKPLTGPYAGNPVMILIPGCTMNRFISVSPDPNNLL